MYNREDYREALEEREKCDLYSDEWRFCQAKVQSIATAMVAAGNNWMVGEIIDELYSLRTAVANSPTRQFDLTFGFLKATASKRRLRK